MERSGRDKGETTYQKRESGTKVRRFPAKSGDLEPLIARNAFTMDVKYTFIVVQIFVITPSLLEVQQFIPARVIKRPLIPLVMLSTSL